MRLENIGYCVRVNGVHAATRVLDLIYKNEHKCKSK